jgi:hypothetical protein
MRRNIPCYQQRNSSQHAAGGFCPGGFVRLIATAISSSAWRRTGASADGSRQVLMKKKTGQSLRF